MNKESEKVNQPKKYVLTGSVCVGKTTLIDLLSKQGFATFPEFSRALINEELKKEEGIFPWTNPAVFQDMYVKKQVLEENEIEKYLAHVEDKTCIFMDRCIVDAIAFCEFPNVPIPKEVNQHVQKLKSTGQDYELIFLLEPLERYHNDEGRLLKAEESLIIQGLIEKSYKDYGYSLISVPFMSPEERVRFILEKVQEHEENLE